MHTKILFEDSNGSAYLQERVLPVPMYEIGQVVAYLDGAEGKTYESEIEGFNIEVTSTTGADGNLELLAMIAYYLVDGAKVFEEEITHYYDMDDE